jgi:ABC-2 type transport system ATP-binding protein
MDAPAVVCRGLTKRYGRVVALAGLDLEVPPGTIFGFLGPNGAGKTTTLRLLTGLAHPTTGSAAVAGVDVTDGAQGSPNGRANASRGSTFGYLDQDPRFYGWMRGRELLELVADLYRMDRNERRARIGEMLDLVGLSEAAGRSIGGYSGGMRQRLGLAAAMLARPAVLFLDEPVSALDPAGRHDLLEVIGRLRGSTTVFMSSHILNDVERVCDRVAILDHGRLLADAPIEELLARYAAPVYRLEPEVGQEDTLGPLEDRLRGASWATAVEADLEGLRIHVTDPRAAGPELFRLIADSGLAVVVLERQRPTLEDVFLRIVADGSTASPMQATKREDAP